jgi:hypothetical protein
MLIERLRVHRVGADRRLDPPLAERVHQCRAAATRRPQTPSQSQHVRLPAGTAVRGVRRQGDLLDIREEFAVARSDFVLPADRGLHARNLGAPDRGRHLGQAIVEPGEFEARGSVLAHHAVVPVSPHEFGDPFIVRHHGAAFSGRETLARVEAEAAGASEPAGETLADHRAEGTRGVFDERDP